ncbi:MAG: hypothetical protein Q7J09_05975 [Methanocalculus sp.]|uniref:hypothetical protein n=1 Tax=Methanocalculus sp. TaxID=2004547 RepID=UPI002727A119|nr:hypothetical protein [Methanocalculus sp.]MDO9539534.1 hypothetical protein [Methanocalculus sp.]
MGLGSVFARDWTISKTSRFFGKNRIADPLLSRLAHDPSPIVREAVLRHAYALGYDDGKNLSARIPDEDPITLIESFLLTAGVPYELRGDRDVVIRKDFAHSSDRGFLTPDIALGYLRGLLAGVLTGWEIIEGEGDIRCRGGK